MIVFAEHVLGYEFQRESMAAQRGGARETVTSVGRVLCYGNERSQYGYSAEGYPCVQVALIHNVLEFHMAVNMATGSV